MSSVTTKQVLGLDHFWGLDSIGTGHTRQLYPHGVCILVVVWRLALIDIE